MRLFYTIPTARQSVGRLPQQKRIRRGRRKPCRDWKSDRDGHRGRLPQQGTPTHVRVHDFSPRINTPSSSRFTTRSTVLVGIDRQPGWKHASSPPYFCCVAHGFLQNPGNCVRATPSPPQETDGGAERMHASAQAVSFTPKCFREGEYHEASYLRPAGVRISGDGGGPSLGLKLSPWTLPRQPLRPLLSAVLQRLHHYTAVSYNDVFAAALVRRSRQCAAKLSGSRPSLK